MRQRWSRSKRQKGWSLCWKLGPFQSWASFLPWLWKVLEILVPKLLNAETKARLDVWPAYISSSTWMHEAPGFRFFPGCSQSRGVEVVNGINLFNNSSIAKKNSPPFNISIPIFQSCMVFPRLTKKCTAAKIFCYNNCSCIGKYWMACYLATFRLLYNNVISWSKLFWFFAVLKFKRK